MRNSNLQFKKQSFHILSHHLFNTLKSYNEKQEQEWCYALMWSLSVKPKVTSRLSSWFVTYKSLAFKLVQPRCYQVRVTSPRSPYSRLVSLWTEIKCYLLQVKGKNKLLCTGIGFYIYRQNWGSLGKQKKRGYKGGWVSILVIDDD